MITLFFIGLCGDETEHYVFASTSGIIQEKNWFPHEGDHIWVKRYKRVKEWGMIKVIRHGRIYRLVPNDLYPVYLHNL